jgi:hypothetical protein
LEQAPEYMDWVTAKSFPQSFVRPIPDDWLLNGLLWVEYLDYLPKDWMTTSAIDPDIGVRFMEDENGSTTTQRMVRALWTAVQLVEATGGKWMTYDAIGRRFSVSSEVEQSSGRHIIADKQGASSVRHEEGENTIQEELSHLTLQVSLAPKIRRFAWQQT